MSRRPLRALVASVALHAVAVTAMLIALPNSEPLPALFVDLTAADPNEQRAGPAPVPRNAVRARARRPPEAAAPNITPSASPPLVEAPDPPEATSEPTAVIPIPLPSLPPASMLPPPPALPTAEPASPPPAPPVSSRAEPESPSASAVRHDVGGRAMPPEPAPTAGGSASDGTPGPDVGAPPIGLPLAPDQRSVRPAPENAAGLGVGAGQQLARGSPASEDADAGAVYAEYLARLRQRVHAALRYPPMARRRGLTGAVTVELTILPSGMIRDVSVVKSSAHRLLDEAAVETVQELGAQPFPAGVPPRTLRVRLPIVFVFQ
ncbi:MAG TPA: TonB family protein [Methylomirabilota bacterium]